MRASWLLLAGVTLGAAVAQGPVRGWLAADAAERARVAAPDFTLPRHDGARSVRLASFQGRVVLLTFWLAGCPHCHEELPVLVRLHRRYQARGLSVLSVLLKDADQRRAGELVRRYGLTFDVLLGHEAIARRYGGVTGVPSTFVIDRQGRVATVFPGLVDQVALEAALRPLL